MSNEISAVSSPGLTVYAMVFKSGQVWNTVSEIFEAYSTGSRASYAILLTELGTSSGIFYGNFPSAITTSGTYEYFIYIRDGATVAEPPTDTLINQGVVDWTGSGAVTADALGGMSGPNWLAYVLKGGFKRTDKDTEVYESTTDAIQELRRRLSFDEAQADTTTTDTISVLGDFKIDIESDFGLLLGIRIQDGTDSSPITIIPKSKFDELYPDINVTSDRGYPVHATLYAGSIYFGPIPDKTTYSYRLSYSKRAGAVTSSTTSVPFTNLYRDILRDLTYDYLYGMEEEFNKASDYRNKFEGKYVDMVHREDVNTGAHVFAVRCQD